MELGAPLAYRTGELEIDRAARRLVRHGVEFTLRPKAFNLLVFPLAEPAPQAARTPSQCIIDLRRTLGDGTRDLRYIRTVPCSGYQFILTTVKGALHPRGEIIGEVGRPGGCAAGADHQKRWSPYGCFRGRSGSCELQKGPLSVCSYRLSTAPQSHPQGEICSALRRLLRSRTDHAKNDGMVCPTGGCGNCRI